MTLIERLEAAPEGSRELDRWVQRGLVRVADVRFSCPAYTTSTDAALSMVPEGWSWHIHWIAWNAALKANASIGNLGGDRAFQSIAPTPALAICIAALKARGSE